MDHDDRQIEEFVVQATKDQLIKLLELLNINSDNLKLKECVLTKIKEFT